MSVSLYWFFFQFVYNWIFIPVWKECRNGYFKKSVEINRGFAKLLPLPIRNPNVFLWKTWLVIYEVLINLQLWPQRKRSMHNVVNECLIGTRKLFREIKIFFPSFRKTQLKLIWIAGYFYWYWYKVWQIKPKMNKWLRTLSKPETTNKTERGKLQF